MPKQTLSVCMIVKNEEDFIERCLNSVRHAADEIIIVDTGSTDGTVAQCKKFGADVHFYKWNDHFADARNFSISKARGDWILWLDADEELDSAKSGKIAAALSNTHAAMLLLPVINYHGDSFPVRENEAFIYHQPRLFRNRSGIQFVNRIHETPELPQELQSKEHIGTLDVPIHHYGYLREVSTRKKKPARNMELLMKEAEQPDHSPWIEYHMAGEFYRQKEYQKAFLFVNQSILGFLRRGKKPPALLYRLKYDILLKSGSIDGAWPSIEKALLLYPDYVDLHFMKGLILYEKGEYAKALETFETCLQLGENHHQYLITRGAGSFLADQYRRLCLEKLQDNKNNPRPS